MEIITRTTPFFCFGQFRAKNVGKFFKLSNELNPRNDMTTLMLVAYQYPYKFILGPALIIIFAIMTALLMKYPSSKNKIGGLMVLAGICEALATLLLAFVSGIFIGIATIIAGIIIIAFKIPWQSMSLFNQRKTLVLRKSIYVILAVVVASSALLITIRATTNLIHEQWLENYPGGGTPNLTLRGVVTEIALNYEVNTGYSYHIFPAYITINVTEFVWGKEFWQNQTSSSEYWQHQRSAEICFDKADVPKLEVGQRIEVNGFMTPWIEDSLYSGKLVVAPQIEGSYVNPI